MKHVTILLISLALLVGCSGVKEMPAPAPTPTAVSEPQIPPHFTTYTDKAGLFSISYPPDWELAPNEELFHAVIPNKAVAVTVTVGATEEGNWKLEDLADLTFQRAYIDDAEEYHEFSRTKLTVDGKEAIILEFEAKYPIATTAMRELILLLRDRDNETVWIVGCGVMPSEDFSYYESDFHAIVRSLRILTDTQQYTSDFGFSIEYPTGYRVAEEIYPSGQGVTITLATSEYPSTNIALTLWLADDNFYFDSPEDFYYRGVMATWETSKGFMVLSERDISIQGMPAREFIFEAGDGHLHAIVSFLDARASVWKESNAYKITYHAPREDWDMTHPVFDKVVKSFKFAK